MQFGSVTPPPTLSSFLPSVLIYICLLVFFFLILIFITSFYVENFFFKPRLSFSLTNLLLFKSDCSPYTSYQKKNVVLCSSHRSLMDCTVIAQFCTGSQFSLPTRVCTCAQTLLMFPNTYTHTKACQKKNSMQRKKEKRQGKKERLTWKI